jgi:ribosomal protein S18 acetylase RimI-like enzyme
MGHRSYLLELRTKAEFRPKEFPDQAVRIEPAKTTDAGLCRRLWTDVGHGFWSEREDWPVERWHRHLDDASVSFWIARRAGETIGFFELTRERDDIKIEGLGLIPAQRDEGLGGGLLSAATEQAFALGAKRIWLHTATDDHPHALPNYQKRGYRIYHEEALKNPLPG